MCTYERVDWRCECHVCIKATVRLKTRRWTSMEECYSILHSKIFLDLGNFIEFERKNSHLLIRIILEYETSPAGL